MSLFSRFTFPQAALLLMAFLLAPTIDGYAQYQIRHQFTLGYTQTDLLGRTDDLENIPFNDGRFEVEGDISSQKFQDNYLDFNTIRGENYFLGYRITLDFNQRFSFDFGAVYTQKSYETRFRSELWPIAGIETFEEFYEQQGSTLYLGLDPDEYRYEESFRSHMIEIPMLVKKNITKALSVYTGLTFGFQIASSDKIKPLGVTDLDEENSILNLAYTDLRYDIQGSVGVDLLFNQRVSFFVQGDYSILALDDDRASKIHFYTLRAGMNIVFRRM